MRTLDEQVEIIQCILSNRRGYMDEKSFQIRRRKEIKDWHDEHGHQLESLVEESRAISFDEEYHSVPRESSKRPSANKDNNSDYGLRSAEYVVAGCIEYECKRCGEVYSYKPSTCYIKDEYGYACYCEDFETIHGPFEGVFLANSEAISTGDITGLARHSVFEEGCNFNDMVVNDNGGLFVGFMSEEDAESYEKVESRWAKFELEKLDYRLEIRAKVVKLKDRIEHHFKVKAREVSKYQELRELQKKANDVLSYGISYYHGEESGCYAEGYLYPSVKVIRKDNTSIKMNGLVLRAFEHSIYLEWAKANDVEVKTKGKLNEFEQSWNKWLELLKEMPDSVNNQAELILNGWFKMDNEDLVRVFKHALYLKRSDNKNHIPYPVFKALQEYQQRIGA